MDIVSYLLGKKAGGSGGGGSTIGTATLIKDMEEGDSTAYSLFQVDTTGYSSSDLINGIDDLYTPLAFINGDNTEICVVGFAPGSVLKNSFNSILKVDGTSFSASDNTIYAFYGNMSMSTYTIESVYILNDLTANVSYGNCVLSDGYTLSVDNTVLPDSVLWECMKIYIDCVGTVATSEGGAEDYFVSTLNSSQLVLLIKRIPPTTITWTGSFAMFSGCTNLQQVDELDVSNVSSLQQCFNNCENLESVNIKTGTNLTNLQNAFYGCKKLITLPQFNTSNVTNFRNAFASCKTMQNVPIVDFSKATDLTDVFSDCMGLTNESVDNILVSCIGAESYSGTKSLSQLGFTRFDVEASRIRALPHYQAFLDAGWTIGYN